MDSYGIFFSCRKDMFAKKDKAIAINNGILAGEVRGETGIEGLRLDFNAGLRLKVPPDEWHVRIGDYTSGQIFFDADFSGGVLRSLEQYCIPWVVEAWLDGRSVFQHLWDCEGQKVCLYIDGSLPEQPPPLGEAVQMLSVARAFGREHDCKLAVRPGIALSALAHRCYPEFEIVEAVPEDAYATYHLGTFNEEYFSAPMDGLAAPWQEYARELLALRGLPEMDAWLPSAPRPAGLESPYVCVAVQASGAGKCWLRPGGWDEVVAYLRGLGYRVLCLDRDRVTDEDGYHIEMPTGAEDFTGNRPLEERLDMLAYADMFIGVSSGLAWLAKAARCPVVLISGITLPYTEFYTPYRVSNRHVCRGCYNDLRFPWNKERCPRHRGTERELECSKGITAEQVIFEIERVRQDNG